MAEPELTTTYALTAEAEADLATVEITVTTDPKTGREIAEHPSNVKSEMPNREERLAELDEQIGDLQNLRAKILNMYEVKT